MFELVHKLFGIVIKQKRRVPVWDKAVKVYEVYNSKGELISRFYLDFYARSNKRSGAWMSGARIRRVRSDGKIQLPVAYITCNFRKPFLIALFLLLMRFNRKIKHFSSLKYYFL